MSSFQTTCDALCAWLFFDVSRCNGGHAIRWSRHQHEFGSTSWKQGTSKSPTRRVVSRYVTLTIIKQHPIQYGVSTVPTTSCCGMYSERSGHVIMMWFARLLFAKGDQIIIFFIMVTFSYPSTKRECGYLLFNWFFFSVIHLYFIQRTYCSERRIYTGRLSHLNTSFVPTLRDFDLSFCPKRRFCYPQKEILYGLFSCVSQGSGIWPKNCQKNWMWQLSTYLPPHTKHWYLHNIKPSIIDI